MAKGQKCKTFGPDEKRKEQQQSSAQKVLMSHNIPSPLLFLCVCASRSLLALSETLLLPQSSLPFYSFTSGPSSAEPALVLLLMPALFSQKARFNRKPREAGAERGGGWCHQNAASVPWLWFSDAYACQSCYCAPSPTGLSKQRFL